MKLFPYIVYINIIIFTIIRKIIGIPYYYVAVPFRAYANNVVFNYVLQNKIYLQRLLERPISELGEYSFNNISFYGYLISPYHNTDGGFIIYRKVSKLQYFLVYWVIWGWLDADSNEDTFDKGYINTIINRERMTFLPNFVINFLKESLKNTYYGNAFDVGDERAKHSSFNIFGSTLWNIRNTAYNFRYMQWEKCEGDKDIFLIEFGNYKFGWLQDEENPKNYSLVAFGWN